jgi:hypothetical protein
MDNLENGSCHYLKNRFNGKEERFWYSKNAWYSDARLEWGTRVGAMKALGWYYSRPVD